MGEALALCQAGEAEGPCGSFVFSSIRKKVNAPAAEPSSRGFPPVINVDAIRRSFPHQWSEYCKLTFKTAYGIQRHFPGIDSKTARAWLKGDHGPTGGFVAAVIDADPNAMKILGRRT